MNVSVRKRHYPQHPAPITTLSPQYSALPLGSYEREFEVFLNNITHTGNIELELRLRNTLIAKGLGDIICSTNVGDSNGKISNNVVELAPQKQTPLVKTIQALDIHLFLEYCDCLLRQKKYDELCSIISALRSAGLTTNVPDSIGNNNNEESKIRFYVGEVESREIARLYRTHGITYFRLGQLEEAIEAMMLSLRYHNTINGRFALAKLYERSGRLDKALQTLNSLLTALPNDETVLLETVKMYSRILSRQSVNLRSVGFVDNGYSSSLIQYSLYLNRLLSIYRSKLVTNGFTNLMEGCKRYSNLTFASTMLSLVDSRTSVDDDILQDQYQVANLNLSGIGERSSDTGEFLKKTDLVIRKLRLVSNLSPVTATPNIMFWETLAESYFVLYRNLLNVNVCDDNNKNSTEANGKKNKDISDIYLDYLLDDTEKSLALQQLLLLYLRASEKAYEIEISHPPSIPEIKETNFYAFANTLNLAIAYLLNGRYSRTFELLSPILAAYDDSHENSIADGNQEIDNGDNKTVTKTNNLNLNDIIGGSLLSEIERFKMLWCCGLAIFKLQQPLLAVSFIVKAAKCADIPLKNKVVLFRSAIALYSFNGEYGSKYEANEKVSKDIEQNIEEKILSDALQCVDSDKYFSLVLDSAFCEEEQRRKEMHGSIVKMSATVFAEYDKKRKKGLKLLEQVLEHLEKQYNEECCNDNTSQQ